MHMADALISPPVAGTMWAATAGLVAYCSRKIRAELDERKAPLMGVLGAFIFSAQMINFSIPVTGSSGHLGGGMILSILLGPHAAFITMASILTVQALFFADGGLLALGCNVFNMAFFPCFVAYPLIFRKIVGERPTQGRLLTGAMAASIAALQLGAFCVVLETRFSGITELPFKQFALLMQPIHLAIGIVEGLVTAAVVGMVWKARPETRFLGAGVGPAGGGSYRKLLGGLALLTCVTAGLLSWFASAQPDGLEWSMAKTSGKEELAVPDRGVFAAAGAVQQKTAFLPDYDFKKSEVSGGTEEAGTGGGAVVPVGTSVAGLVGAGLTLALVAALGWGLRSRRRIA
ncbi:MAG TPA: energy-coupling factor ABC transporter permease [Candidatus Sumerlaeota bacterium]|nr:energy-coupling factor ABC transporter permease [Candidatus Sumerlaeota bacterium]